MHPYRIAVVLLALVFAPSAVAAPAWDQHEGPVLTATRPWEDGAVQEPNVLYDRKAKLYRMWFTGGTSGKMGIGYATSRDGIRWGKYDHNPVLGQGGGGLTGNVAHQSVMQHKGVYYAFYTIGEGGWDGYDGALYMATSKDGKRWLHHPRPVVPTGSWNQANSNSHVWVDERGWHVLFDSMNRATGYWEMGIAHGPAPSMLAIDPRGPLYSLKPSPDQNCFGGPWLRRLPGGLYELHYIASTGPWNIPSLVYRATSRDLFNWTPQRAPVLDFEQSWQVDQVADPSIANGLLFFDGLDNTDLVRMTSAIGVARRG